MGYLLRACLLQCCLAIDAMFFIFVSVKTSILVQGKCEEKVVVWTCLERLKQLPCDLKCM